MSVDASALNILECTLRDGSYAVDFKFTLSDTRVLTRQLEKLGFRWIEVGHGVGLGGTEAGKGRMICGDEEVVRAAKSVVTDARIGMFFIPGIGRMEHLEMARSAGLDFVRIGMNATEVAKAYPYLRRARDLGLVPFLNFMKSYAITPEDFAQRSKEAVEAGAEVIYCVDSAGSMMPEDVARYFDAVRDRVDCAMGFHGHNNLMMVIANCLTAYRHGVRFLDATLAGLGRSAGNAPTEILIAAFERAGIRTGHELFDVMDTVEAFMWPIVMKTRPNDMIGVTSGYSQFHSSFLPKVAAAARRHKVDLRRLVAKVAFHDPVNLDEAYLESAALEMAGTNLKPSSDPLISFHVPELASGRISTSVESVQALISGLSVACAKRPGTRPALHLVSREGVADDFLLAEFVLSEPQAVLGRVVCGSLETLKQVSELAKKDVFVFFVNQAEGWASQAPRAVADIVGSGRVVPVRDEEVRKQFLVEMLDRAGQRYGRGAFLAYGADPVALKAVGEKGGFEKKFVFGVPQDALGDAGTCVALNDWADWRNLDLRFNVILCAADPPEDDARMLARALAPGGKVVSVLGVPSATLKESLGDGLLHVNMDLAYVGLLSRFLSTETVFGPLAQDEEPLL